jgi:hypothetical protein
LGEHRDKFTFFTFLFVCSNRALYYSNKWVFKIFF